MDDDANKILVEDFILSFKNDCDKFCIMVPYLEIVKVYFESDLKPLTAVRKLLSFYLPVMTVVHKQVPSYC